VEFDLTGEDHWSREEGGKQKRWWWFAVSRERKSTAPRGKEKKGYKSFSIVFES
jgi:hypothetical protein